MEANKLILQSMTGREENRADLTEELSLNMGHSWWLGHIVQDHRDNSLVIDGLKQKKKKKEDKKSKAKHKHQMVNIKGEIISPGVVNFLPLQQEHWGTEIETKDRWRSSLIFRARLVEGASNEG